jgi:hypothetical protein
LTVLSSFCSFEVSTFSSASSALAFLFDFILNV